MASSKRVLVTGGAGYIGSHTCVELLQSGFSVTVLDNLDNSNEESVKRVREITGCAEDDLRLEIADLLDLSALEKVFQKSGPFCACIHFAGLKAVGESVKLPIHYYANNVTGTLNLLHVCKKFKLFRFVFSSSATVYGDPDYIPIPESHPLRSTNPYGKTKLHIEEILRDVNVSEPGVWNIAILRYFNPIGAHPSGRIGEDPYGVPNNLVPFIAQLAVGRRDKLMVFGNDYDTRDGTGVRDYLHVVDLAKAHVAATRKVLDTPKLGAEAYNLGTGDGKTVLEMLAAFSKACGKDLAHEIAPRRDGDVTILVADASKAKKELGWEAKLTVDQACADGWKWQVNNPYGFTDKASDGTATRDAIVFQLYGQP